MRDESKLIVVSGPALNSGAEGVTLARQVLDSVQAGGPVVLELSAVQRMTASFANALVMTLLEAAGDHPLSDVIEMRGVQDSVRREWEKAESRYRRGIRLSTQHPRSA